MKRKPNILSGLISRLLAHAMYEWICDVLDGM